MSLGLRKVMREAVIVSAVRTPTGKFLGALKDFTAIDLGALVVAEAVRRAAIDPARVDECIMGNVVGAGLGQNPARQAALRGGLANHVGALTINMVCGSGLKAVMLAAQGIGAGDADVVVAGGMESMSNAPYLLPHAREGWRMGAGAVVDAMIQDGLWCAFEQCHMGNAGEVVADEYAIAREAQDALRHTESPQGRGGRRRGTLHGRNPAGCRRAKERRTAGVRSRRIDSARRQRRIARGAEAGIQGRWDGDGRQRPGRQRRRVGPPGDGGRNARTLSALAPMARIVGQATSGLPPRLVLMTPVEAVRTLAAKIGWNLADVDLFELNEAFSAQAVAVIRALDIDPERVNVHGGAVALGHAIGSSGARVLTTLLYALARRGLKRGIATLCLGGGNGVALAIERV